MSARIARGGAAPRRAPGRAVRRRRKAQGEGQAAGPARRPADRAGTARKLGIWAFVATLIVVAVAAAVRLPHAAADRHRDRRAGRRGRLHGDAASSCAALNRIAPSAIYKIALDQPSHGRCRWSISTRSATGCCAISAGSRKRGSHRRLPDTLVVEIVERVPAAIWQHNRQLQPDRRRRRRARSRCGLEAMPRPAAGDRPRRQAPARHARRPARRRAAAAAACSPARPGSAAGAGTCASRPARRCRCPKGEEPAAPGASPLRRHGPAPPVCSAAASCASTCASTAA